ncbi:MAG: hypothetical protein GX902_03530 [Lentisphaerae bacterium]|nr:hypothetical protein [Lentisphaerota bacterium]
MTLTAFFLILVSAFLHAGWNFISKKSVPSLAFYSLSCGTAALLWLLPFLASDFSCARMSGRFWLLTGTSIFFEILYVAGLAYSYRLSDISLVYPLARALPLLLTAAVTAVFNLGSRQMGPQELLGMGIVFCGCLMMPLQRFRDFRLSSYCNIVIVFILLAAIGTTGYTVVDSVAMAEIQAVYQRQSITLSIAYLFFIEAGIALGTGLLAVCRRSERQEFSRLVRLKSPFLTGICSSSAYVLILLSMNFVSNVCYVQAFRQISLPLGVLAGILILKESHGLPKILGTTLIVLGLLLVAFAS